ncbi:MAG: prepilin-type N-terminal cleavage/methylation domain-containing protein [Deltaproteobacteria bacterium]|nr:prepilin-type N-terminal cleavage/methylation domain-containing protein [Deltaproteobacteria bacterium]
MRRTRLEHGGVRGRGGFTLIEVLVALALVSAIVAALYGTFFSVLRGRDTIDSSLERSREVGRFLDTFSKEVSSSFYKDGNKASILIGENRDSRGRPASSIVFTAFTYPVVKEDASGGDLLAVRYFTETDDDGKMTLYKEAWDAYRGGKLPMKLPVIEEIEGFEVSFLSGNGWAKAWDTSLEKRLPTAIKAVVSIREEGSITEYRAIPRTVIR